MSFLWRRLREAHDLNLRVTGWVLTSDEVDEIAAMHKHFPDFSFHVPGDGSGFVSVFMGVRLRKIIESRG